MAFEQQLSDRPHHFQDRPDFQERPKFTVHEPFNGVTTVQMNMAFSQMLQNLFNDLEDIEPEFFAFLLALRNPMSAKERFNEKRRNFNGVRTSGAHA